MDASRWATPRLSSDGKLALSWGAVRWAERLAPLLWKKRGKLPAGNPCQRPAPNQMIHQWSAESR